MTPALRSRLLIAALYGSSAAGLLAFLAVQTSFPLRWEWFFFGTEQHGIAALSATPVTEEAARTLNYIFVRSRLDLPKFYPCLLLLRL